MVTFGGSDAHTSALFAAISASLTVAVTNQVVR
jgi:hypothetical protein